VLVRQTSKNIAGNMQSMVGIAGLKCSGATLKALQEIFNL
jgi:hypothetical protein